MHTNHIYTFCILTHESDIRLGLPISSSLAAMVDAMSGRRDLWIHKPCSSTVTQAAVPDYHTMTTP